MNNEDLIESNLLAVLSEVRVQTDVGRAFPPGVREFDEQVEQIRECIQEGGEAGVAYESLVAMLEMFPFQLSGPTAIKLLEVGLLAGYKTERPEDAKFDRR